MTIYKCKMCGGSLEINESSKICTCDYCGAEQTLPSVRDEIIQSLFNRATTLRMKSDFDKASEIYEKILQANQEEAEAYWGLILCKYGIEYVEDPSTYKRIPTCHRASYDAVVSDEDYKNALQYADMDQRRIYEEQAKQIDEIQKGIIALAQKADPYDVFICYKETDENGNRTQDSVIANDIYYQLTQEGYKVFYAAITLEDKLGAEYEPYIFSALNSAKVMLAIGTKPEYFQAVWVKNEWSRFLKMMKKDRSRLLIPCFRDMDAYELPEEFAHLQAQNMAKIGFINDLVRGIKKVIVKESKKAQETVVVQQTAYNSNITALLKRGNMALEDGEWEKADGFFEEVLNQDAECAESYLGKYLAEKRAADVEKLKIILSNENIRVDKKEHLLACDEETKRISNIVTENTIPGYLEADSIRKMYNYDRAFYSEIKERREQKQKQLSRLEDNKLLSKARKYAKGKVKEDIDSVLNNIISVLDNRIKEAEKADADNTQRIKAAYETFLNETDEKVKRDRIAADERKERDYQKVLNQISIAKTVSDFELAINSLEPFKNYKDAVEQIEYCKKEIDRIDLEQKEAIYQDLLKQKREAKYEKDFENIGARFREIYTYKDSGKLAEDCTNEIERLKLEQQQREEAEREAREKEAKRIAKKKKIIKIASIFAAIVIIGSVIFINKIIIPNIRWNNEKEDLKKASVGDIVEFGNYNGNKEWIVLEREDNKVLLISKNAIEKRPYNKSYISVTWETCDLREWLNNDYINSAFGSEKAKAILTTTVKNPDDSAYNTEGGNDTSDKVFLLSIEEAKKYFASDADRKATYNGEAEWWWLRSPGNSTKSAARVYKSGGVYEYGYSVNYEYGIRPALWVDISNL